MSRVLSETEQFFYEVGQLVTQNMAMAVTVNSLIPQPVLRRALDMLQAKPPPLQWKIITDGNYGRPPPLG